MGKAKIILPEEYHLPGLRQSEDCLEGIIDDAEALARTDNPHAIVEALVRIAHAYQQIDTLVSRLKKLDKDIRSTLLPDVFGEKTSSITTLGYRATVSHQVRASIYAEKKQEALSWLEANGHGAIIDREPRVNPSTLSAWARTQIEDDEDLSEDLFSIFHFDNTSLTKATRK